MAIALWPATLPQDVLRGYGFAFPRLREGFGTDVGPGKSRRRFTSNVEPFDLRVRLTRAQVPILRAFYTDTLDGGTQPFEWIDPIDKTTATFLFRGNDPPAPRHDRGNEYLVELRLNRLPG